jgi:hypothetical protein
MKILRYQDRRGARYGVLDEDGDSVRELVGSPFDDPKAGRRVTALSDVRLLPRSSPRRSSAWG